MFFNGDNSTIIQASSVGEVENFSVRQGDTYQLGSDVNVSGVRSVANVVVTNLAADTTYVMGADYMLNPELGRIRILPGGSIPDDETIVVTYDVDAVSREQVISGFEATSCSVRFISDNAGGNKRDFFIPNAELSANGDLALVGDEWQTVGFSIKALRKDGMEAIYADGRAYTG